jgi:hypothetical protein
MMSKGGIGTIKARLNPDVAHYLQNYKRSELLRLEEHHRTRILIQGDSELPPGRWEMEAFKRISEGETLKPGEVAHTGLEESPEDGRDILPGAGPAAAEDSRPRNQDNQNRDGQNRDQGYDKGRSGGRRTQRRGRSGNFGNHKNGAQEPLPAPLEASGVL